MCSGRTKTFEFGTLSELFNAFDGYYDLVNEELYSNLLRWDLLDEENQCDETIAYSFMKWSFTVSFLELVNAFQWFLTGVILDRQAVLPAQVMQMYYYSIFFSYGSFLAGHGKGHYTIKEERGASNNITSTRREVWFEPTIPPRICLLGCGGGEHKRRAKWFYEVFRNWEFKDNFPSISLFERDRTFHTGFRNMFTYKLSEMANELYGTPNLNQNMPSNEVLLALWNYQDENLPDYLPEEFWALEHLKPALNLHVELLQNYEGDNLCVGAQSMLVDQLISHHTETGVFDFLQNVLNPLVENL